MIRNAFKSSYCYSATCIIVLSIVVIVSFGIHYKNISDKYNNHPAGTCEITNFYYWNNTTPDDFVYSGIVTWRLMINDGAHYLNTRWKGNQPLILGSKRQCWLLNGWITFDDEFGIVNDTRSGLIIVSVVFGIIIIFTVIMTYKLAKEDRTNREQM